MSDVEILVPLKIDLGISASSLDEYLRGLVASSIKFIETEGIKLNTESIDDCTLIEMYAAYLYRSRRDPNSPMPRSLRWALNNRLVHQKGAADAN